MNTPTEPSSATSGPIWDAHRAEGSTEPGTDDAHTLLPPYPPAALPVWLASEWAWLGERGRAVACLSRQCYAGTRAWVLKLLPKHSR